MGRSLHPPVICRFCKQYPKSHEPGLKKCISVLCYDMFIFLNVQIGFSKASIP